MGRVWRQLTLADKYGLHFDRAKTTLYVLAGDNFSGDLLPFEALGVRIVKGVDVQMLQVPVSGSHDFFSEWNRRKIVEIDEAIGAVEQLPHKHIALHLLQRCLSFPKLLYCARTVGSTHLQPLLLAHSDKLRATLRFLVGQEPSEVLWRQATLPTKVGGLGLLIDDIPVQNGRLSRADIAMVCSWQATCEQIRSLLGPAAETDVDLDRTLALRALSPHFPHLRLDSQHTILNHRDLTQAAMEKLSAYLLAGSGPGEATRLLACKAKWADGWLGAIPSICSDTLLSTLQSLIPFLCDLGWMFWIMMADVPSVYKLSILWAIIA